MNLKELALRVRKDPKNTFDPSWEKLARCLDVEGLYWSEDPRLKCYWIDVWFCTDTHVGERAYYLDGELVCASIQPFRKYDESFYFVSAEAAKKLKYYLRDLADQLNPIEIKLLDDITDISANDYEGGYMVMYASQLIPRYYHQTAKLKWTDEIVTVSTKMDRLDKENDRSIKVINADGKTVAMDCRDLIFDYHIEK